MRWRLSSRQAASAGVGLLLLALLAVVGGGVLAERDRRADIAAGAAAAATERTKVEQALREAVAQGARDRNARLADERAAIEQAAQRAAEQAVRNAAAQAARASQEAAQQAVAERASCLALLAQGRQTRAASAASVSAKEAGGVNRSDDLAVAAVASRGARRDLALTERGTPGYARAVARVGEAQRLIVQIQAERRAMALVNAADPSDPVAVTNAQLEAARLRLEALNASLPPARPLPDFEGAATGPQSERDCP